MQLNAIDLIVSDVPAATRFFRDVLGLDAQEADERSARFQSGSMTLTIAWLRRPFGAKEMRPDAVAPATSASGLLLHFQVQDVGLAVLKATATGAQVLAGPDETGWGTNSAILAGPEHILIELYSVASN